MKIKNRLGMVILCVSTAVGMVSCGDGGNVGTVCDAAAEAVFDQCDQTKTEDQIAIITAFASFGIILSPTDVESATEGDLASECKSNLDIAEVEIEDADADDFVEELSTDDTCQDVIDTISTAVNQL